MVLFVDIFFSNVLLISNSILEILSRLSTKKKGKFQIIESYSVFVNKSACGVRKARLKAETYCNSPRHYCPRSHPYNYTWLIALYNVAWSYT